MMYQGMIFCEGSRNSDVAVAIRDLLLFSSLKVGFCFNFRLVYEF